MSELDETFLVSGTIGNHVGGVVFVAFLHYLRSRLHFLNIEK